MNFEKDYLGVNNLPDKDKGEPNIINSEEKRPNMEALEKKRDAYIDVAIEKCREDIKKIYLERKNDSQNLIIKLVFDQIISDHNISSKQENNATNSEFLQELKDTYSHEAIQKRVNMQF